MQIPRSKPQATEKKVAVCSIATTETYTNGAGEKVKDTQWHRLVAWGRNADVLERYVTKGSEIAIEGKLTHRSYESKEGQKRWITEIIVAGVLLMRSANQTTAA